jgi:hypothetical protein
MKLASGSKETILHLNRNGDGIRLRRGDHRLPSDRPLLAFRTASVRSAQAVGSAIAWKGPKVNPHQRFLAGSVGPSWSTARFQGGHKFMHGFHLDRSSGSGHPQPSATSPINCGAHHGVSPAGTSEGTHMKDGRGTWTV